MMHHRTALLVALLLAPAGLLAQDEEVVSVSGKVTINGEPLPAGIVIFHGKGAGMTYSTTIYEGKYTLRAAAGTFKATISTTGIEDMVQQHKEEIKRLERRLALIEETKKKDETLVKRIGETKVRLKMLEEVLKTVKGVKLPEKYKSPDTSGLSVEIMAGKNELDIKLK